MAQDDLSLVPATFHAPAIQSHQEQQIVSSRGKDNAAELLTPEEVAENAQDDAWVEQDPESDPSPVAPPADYSLGSPLVITATESMVMPTSFANPLKVTVPGIRRCHGI